MVLPVGIPVVVCSGSDSSDHHHHQRVQQVAAVDVEESPAALQLHRRRSAKYQPTTWDYDSICSLLSRRPLPLPLGGTQQEEAAADDAIANHLQLVATSITDISSEMESESVQASLKDSVKRLLLVLEEDGDRSRLLLRTIHQLQSLGIAYHFHQEIRGILMSTHQHHGRLGHHHDLDLHSAALLFRMLRELGIPASTDMLMSALREEGDKITDSDALLALYQASYLAFPGDTVLDQARAFAVGKLAARDDSDLCTHLSSTLPLHWRAPRLQAVALISL